MLGTGTISLLRKGLTTLGLVRDWDAERAIRNPVSSVTVSQYQVMLKEKQVKAGITQKSAALLIKMPS